MSELPVFREVSPAPLVPDVLKKFSDAEGLILFESVRRHERLGRYSFLVADPICTSVLQAPEYGTDPFSEVKIWSEKFQAPTHPDLPPFQGGFAGLLSYDLGQCWERLAQSPYDEFQIPASVIGVYDWVIAWDHFQEKCWVIAHGFPEATSSDRTAKAESTLGRLLQRMTAETIASPKASPCRNRSIEIETSQHSVDPAVEMSSNFSAESYQAAVQCVIDYIVAGDLFQANISQRLLGETDCSTVQIYLALREHNPAPFAGLLQFEDWAVLSSSPERFIQKTGNQLSTRPIKGTRKRQSIPEADLYTRDELRESDKDQSENIMIVDLLRNDLSRVCQPGTVRVPELCTVEAYETVTHLVSEVTGQLRENISIWDTIQATFPGGSITGAPKIRAMEIIAELEQVARGPYCGSLFYCGFDGTADSNILIRTITKRGRNLAFPVGGGIVAQSEPQAEYDETLHKAAGLRAALESLKAEVDR